MKILALQAFDGSSHQSALDGWMSHSQHEFDVVRLPGRHWKWRMRHAAWHFAEHVAGAVDRDEAKWDLIFCTDMLNVAEFRGLVAQQISTLPIVTFFHENQFVYPTRVKDPRDLHFAITNFSSALASDQVWFNSEFNRDSMFEALRELCKHWPDFPPTRQVEELTNKCHVMQLGIEAPSARREPPGKTDRPLHLIWAARWEHDKGPDQLLEVLRICRSRELDFRLSLIGQSYREIPLSIQTIESEFADVLVNFGYMQSRAEYWQALSSADVWLSTADHEFFGIAAVEAIAAGLYPIFPNRLAYPELRNLFSESVSDPTVHFYETSPQAVDRIETAMQNGSPAVVDVEEFKQLTWEMRASVFDQMAESVLAREV